MSNYRVAYLVNGNIRNKSFGYERSDVLVYAGTIVVDELDGNDHAVCEHAFMTLNRDDRPFGKTAPSMSTGDVVCVSGGGVPGHRYYVCERMGFSALDEPPTEFVPAEGSSCADVLHAIVDSILREN